MPRKSPYVIMLSDDEQKHLQRLSAEYTSAYYSVIRSKIVLYAAQGMDNKSIAQRLDLPRQVVSKWRKRFFERGLEGLKDLPRPGRPRGQKGK